MTRKLSLFFVQLMYTTANSTRTLMFEAQAHTCIYSNTTTPSFTCVRRHELHCCLKLIKYPYKKRTLIYIYYFFIKALNKAAGRLSLICVKSWQLVVYFGPVTMKYVKALGTLLYGFRVSTCIPICIKALYDLWYATTVIWSDLLYMDHCRTTFLQSS